MSTPAASAAISRAVQDDLGVRVVSCEVRPHAYATSHALVDAEAKLDDGRSIRLVVKEAGARPPGRPLFVHRADREAEVYRQLLLPAGSWAPRLLGTLGPTVVLEWSPGIPLWQCEAGRAASLIGKRIREMHDALATRVNAPFLLQYDRAFFERWFHRACRLEPAVTELAEAHAIAVPRLLGEPRVAIHGELYPSNILVDGDAVAIVDWEGAAAGPAVIDLAALVTGWPNLHVETLLGAYGDVDAVALDCARLHLALRWLGWSRDWTPPREHAWDWRAEAKSAAERITEEAA